MNESAIHLANQTQQRRLDYRVHYPAGNRPKLRLFGLWREVLDISSAGICFRFVRGDSALVRQRITATVIFQDAPALLVVGTVVHVSDDEVSASLESGFAFDVIVRERLLVMSFNDAHQSEA